MIKIYWKCINNVEFKCRGRVNTEGFHISAHVAKHEPLCRPSEKEQNEMQHP
jgi:hypothetical protein